MTMKSEVAGQGIVRLIAKKKGPVIGPVIGIVCNVHGNELCGRKAVHRVLSNYEIERGTLVLIDGNPNAALLGRRYVSADMNRMFTTKQLNKKNPKQDLKRAQYLAQKLPKLGLDQVIDFHSTTSETPHPFTVSFPGTKEMTSLCPMPQIFGWSGIVKGTLIEWLCNQGIPAVVVEAGRHEAQSSIDMAEQTLLSILSHFGLITPKKPIKFKKPPQYKVLERVMVGDHASFKFKKDYSSFEALKPGETIAKDKTQIYKAPNKKGLMMLMPSTQAHIDKKISRGAYYLMQKI
ncbi:MAG: succinylglutamate desuccinylase/aspartoacylase family protein [Cohaesibacter sp.]|nr:succinylglutamate desuccinylase/aspartoacylase family protein [Cohaesibacter sp.]